MSFIIQDSRMRAGAQYVAAPPGYRQLPDGSITIDGPKTGGAEWGPRPHEFKTHRSAGRTLSKCFDTAKIKEWK